MKPSTEAPPVSTVFAVEGAQVPEREEYNTPRIHSKNKYTSTNFNRNTSTLNIAGNSICELNTTKQINGEIRAAGKVWFKGTPKIKVKTFDQALIGNQSQRPKE